MKIRTLLMVSGFSLMASLVHAQAGDTPVCADQRSPDQTYHCPNGAQLPYHPGTIPNTKFAIENNKTYLCIPSTWTKFKGTQGDTWLCGTPQEN